MALAHQGRKSLQHKQTSATYAQAKNIVLPHHRTMTSSISLSPEWSRRKVKLRKAKKPTETLHDVQASEDEESCGGVNGIPRWEQPIADLRENCSVSNQLPPRTAPPKTRKPSNTKQHNDRALRAKKKPIMPSLENKVVSVKMKTHAPMHTNAFPDHNSSFTVLDLVHGDSSTPLSPVPGRKHSPKKKDQLERVKRHTRVQRHSYTEHQPEEKNALFQDDQLSLQELYSSWKQDDNNTADTGCLSSPCAHSNSEISSITGCMDEEYVFGPANSSSPKVEQHVLQMQEEALIQLALERSVHDFSQSNSTFSDSNCSSTMDSYSCGPTADMRARPKIPKPPKPGAKSKYGMVGLGGAGCHLSMMGSQVPRKTGEDMTAKMLQTTDNPSDDEDDNILPSIAVSDSTYIWKRDPESNKWYKKPVASKTVIQKSEDDMMMQRVSELSMKDCLATSLNELQAVSRYR